MTQLQEAEKSRQEVMTKLITITDTIGIDNLTAKGKKIYLNLVFGLNERNKIIGELLQGAEDENATP